MLQSVMKFIITGLTMLVVGLLLSVAPSFPQAEAQGPVQATVTTDTLNVRGTPGDNGELIDRFTLNTVLNVEGREDQQGNGGVWVFAQPASGGSRGWVLSDWLLFPDNFRIEDLPIIDVTGEAGANANVSDPATSSNPAPSVDGGVSGSTVNPINFRNGPGTNFGIVQGLNAGVSFTATGRLSNNTWVRAVVNGQEGWLFASLVNINGDINSLPIVENVPVQNNPAPAPATTGGSIPAAVASTRSISGFTYGAHVANFNNGDLMAQMGMTWIKVQVRYGVGQDPNSVSGLISTAHAQGFRILLGVVGYPGDVAAGGEGYYDQYAAFVGGVAALGADAIEVWNEPNLDREWPTGQISGANYTQLLARAFNSIKANNPNTLVISAALAPTGAEGAFGLERVWNDNRFLDSMRAAGAAAYMDCLGAHYNEGIVSPYQTSGDPRGDNYYTRYLLGMINTYRSYFPSKPLCFTELGYLTPEGYGGLPGAFGWAGDTSVAEHALWLAQAIDVSRNSGVRMVIIWNLNFTGSFGDDPMGGYAMIRPDATCPACAYFPR